MATITHCDKCKKEKTKEEESEWTAISVYSYRSKIEKFRSPQKFEYCTECGKKILKKIIRIL
mgnify:CR=1 FL=1